MKRHPGRAALTVILFLLIFPGSGFGQSLQADQEYSPNVVIAKFTAESAPASLFFENGIAQIGIAEFDDLNRRFQAVEMRPLFPGAAENGAPEMAGYYRLIFDGNSGLEAVLSAYNALSCLETAEPVPIHRMNFLPNDPFRTSQWALTRIDAYQAWDITQGSSSVPLAILDTGVDWNHPDLDGDIWLNAADPIGGGDTDGNGYIDDYRGWDFVTGISGCWSGEDCSGEDNDPMDFAGHGTHTAGIAAAETNNGVGVAGIGFDCLIMCLRVGWLANDGWGYISMDFAAEALYYAGNKGAKAANCSWGSSYTSYLANAVSYANSHGVVIVTAAGNDGNSNASYLGSRTDVIAVAATDQADHKASWSNYGTWVEIAAPGVSIYSTYFNNTYTYLDGTSMSAPHVVGVVGLICSADPSLSRSQVFNLVIDSAEPINDTYYNQGFLGSGRLNAYNAVMDLGGLDPPNPASPPNSSFTEDTTPTFSWSPVDGATKYHIQIAETNQFTSPYVENSNVTQTSYTTPVSLFDGVWYWRVRAGDGTDWSDWSAAWSLAVDTEAPGSPIGLSVTPDGWSGNPDFTFDWTDPSDLSGISLRLYKLDSPPVHDLDYNGTFGDPPAIYTASSSGSHTLYLWCMDNLGHVDHLNNASVVFYFDNSAPTGCTASSPSYSSTESFTVSWSIGSDNESGLSGLYDVRYKADEGAWTDWLIGTTDLSAIFTGLDGHIYYFEARTSDNVGNYEQFTGNAESSTFVNMSGSSCGYYVIGDYNGSLSFNVADVVDAFSRLKTGLPEPALLCECPAGSGNFWAVAMDVNNSCAFNVADIIDGFSRLKTGSPILAPCAMCPPQQPPIPPGNENPLITVKMDPKQED